MSESIPRQRCPFCGYAMDCTDGLESEKPKVGDISLCLKCMELSLFADGFILRAPTATELTEIQRSLSWTKIEQARAGMASAKHQRANHSRWQVTAAARDE